MITTSEIVPSTMLAPFIRCYSYIEFDTKGLVLIKSANARHEMTMSFYFKAKPVRLLNPGVVQTFENSYGGVIGLFTQDNGDMIFNGHYIFFEIYFKPNGFNKIFRLPPREVNNQLVFANDIFDSGIKIFYEQLGIARNVNEMVLLADAYLLRYLNKQKRVDYEDSMTYISNLILKKAGNINIEKLAYEANMSIRSFERHFIEQVGISPKLFCNITRFNYAFALKLKSPQLDWTSIALKSGYFDQMHLIKDFKKFSGNTPSIFLKETPLTKENYTSRVEA